MFRGDYIDSRSKEISEGAKTRDHTSTADLCILVSYLTRHDKERIYV